VIPRDGATIFRDIVGKLDVLNVESDKGGRRGRYPAHRLVERYGMDAKLFDWSNKITAEASAKLERPVAARGTQICRKLCNVWRATGSQRNCPSAIRFSPRLGLACWVRWPARCR